MIILGSHFSPKVVNAAIAHNVYFTSLPPNSKHMTQPLDVAVFRPMKVVWRALLDDWRKFTRRQGTIPKEAFPNLLNKLWEKMQPTVQANLRAAFRVTGLCPFNPQELLKHLPESNTDEIGHTLDESLIKLLQENRGYKDAPKQPRGKKIKLGLQITPSDVALPENELPGPSGIQQLTDQITCR